MVDGLMVAIRSSSSAIIGFNRHGVGGRGTVLNTCKNRSLSAAGRTASSTNSNITLSLAIISIISTQFVRRNFDLPQDR